MPVLGQRISVLSRDVVLARRAWAHRELIRAPKHVNGVVELTWIEHGSMGFELRGEVVQASAGACIVLPQGVENTPFGRAAAVHQLYLPQALLDEASSELGQPLAPRAASARGPGDGITSLMQVLAADVEDGAPPDAPSLSALIDSLIFRLPEKAPHARRELPDARVRRALDMIAWGYAQPLTVEKLARAAGMSPFAFSRAFRAQVGESPYRKLTQVRLEHAAQRLRSSSAPILEVALDCGFGDPGRFARAFRERYGCTPRQYRGR